MPSPPKKPEPPKSSSHQHKPLQQPHASSNIKASITKSLEVEVERKPIPSGVPSAEEMGIPLVGPTSTEIHPPVWNDATPGQPDSRRYLPPGFNPIPDLNFAQAVVYLQNGVPVRRFARWMNVLGPDDVNAVDWQTAPSPSQIPVEDFVPTTGLSFAAAQTQLQNGVKVRRAARWNIVLGPDDYNATDWQTAPIPNPAPPT